MRASVCKLTLAKEMWKAAAAAAADAGAGDKKKKDAKKDPKAAVAETDEEITPEKLLMFAEGPDLEAEAEERAAALAVAKAAAEAAAMDGGDAPAVDESSLPLTTPRGTHGLVHLRDGKVVGDYGLANESIVYVCIDK